MSQTEITKEEQILNELIQNKARLKRIKREVRLDVVNHSDIKITLNEITLAVLQLITEINKRFISQ